VRIHLQRTADGLVARVVAGHDAAQAFTQNAGDLRRSLQASGINLVRLDVDVAGDRDATDRGAQAQPDGASGRGRAPALAAEESADDGSATPNTTRTVELGAGALVNVLA
jgi:predicted secreted protein